MFRLFLSIILPIILAFFLFFSFSAYQYYVALHSDDPIVPYVLVEEGAVTVVRGDIAIDMTQADKYDLKEKDTIITAKDSLAIVHWPDKSITRLGASSRMRIEKMQVAIDYTSIEIEFALEQGQVWSTVVRTIYPGSYFRTRLPNQGVIAGVRGTVYDIDLTRGYIRSIDHSVTLSDAKGNAVSLLPGELVSITNILKKLSKEVVDQAWNTMNQARDAVFIEEHTQALRDQMDKLSGQTGGIWDKFVRFILGFVSFFDDLQFFETLNSQVKRLEDIDISQEQLLRFYQKFQDTKFVQEREKIRAYISSHSGSLALDTSYIETFARGAIWDQLSFSGLTLDGAQDMVDSYTKTLDAQLQSVMQVIPVGELNTKARETLRALIR